MINGKLSSLFSWRMLSDHPGFTICHRWYFSFHLIAIVLSILCIVLNTGQTIGLTLFLGSFKDLTGVYFVVFFTAFSYGFLACLVACWFGYKGQITPAMREWRWTKYMFFVSIFDAANAFLITFSSHGSRVPPALTSILSQITIPFTFLFSKCLLRKKYRWLHFFSVCLVLIGVTFSLVPTFKQIHDGTTDTALQHGWYWPFIFIAGCIPSAIKSIIQEQLQVEFTEYARKRQEKITRFSVSYFQAVETTFQVILIAACFSLDFVPGFGTSANIQQWWTSFSNGFKCFFNVGYLPDGQCHAAAGTGVLYIISCLLASVVGTFLTDHISANWLAIVSSISPLLSTSFWFVFPAINRWAGVSDTTTWDIGFSLGALPIIFIGMVLYRNGGTDRQSDEEIPLIAEHPTEFFW
jgi:drug/metabolite transporter (DMT)-like permease